MHSRSEMCLDQCVEKTNNSTWSKAWLQQLFQLWSWHWTYMNLRMFTNFSRSMGLPVSWGYYIVGVGQNPLSCIICLGFVGNLSRFHIYRVLTPSKIPHNLNQNRKITLFHLFLENYFIENITESCCQSKQLPFSVA